MYVVLTYPVPLRGWTRLVFRVSSVLRPRASPTRTIRGGDIMDGLCLSRQAASMVNLTMGGRCSVERSNHELETNRCQIA